MMGYVEDIKQKLSRMHDRRLHEDFYRLTDALLASRQYDKLPYVLNIINQYDDISRKNYSLNTTVNNLRRTMSIKYRGQ